MPDPDTVAIPVLAGATLAQGITFLYSQAAEVLHIRREHKATQRPALTLPDAFEPLRIATSPDPTVLEARVGELAALLGVAKVYTARGADTLDGADPVFRACFGGLRDVLEAVYGARFTFVGEARSGRRVRQVVEDVRGPTTGLRFRGPGADAKAAGDVDQQVGTVHRGAELIGMDIDLRG